MPKKIKLINIIQIGKESIPNEVAVNKDEHGNPLGETSGDSEYYLYKVEYSLNGKRKFLLVPVYYFFQIGWVISRELGVNFKEEELLKVAR